MKRNPKNRRKSALLPWKPYARSDFPVEDGKSHQAETKRKTDEEKISFPVRLCLFPIRFYRRYLSPLRPPCCRFVPSCSAYAMEALKEWGVFRGGFLALKRILRCHPYGKSGYDPVPKNPKKHDSSKTI